MAIRNPEQVSIYLPTQGYKETTLLISEGYFGDKAEITHMVSERNRMTDLLHHRTSPDKDNKIYSLRIQSQYQKGGRPHLDNPWLLHRH